MYVFISNDIGILSPTMFTMMVIMTLTTTFMIGPALELVKKLSEKNVKAGKLILAGNKKEGLR